MQASKGLNVVRCPEILKGSLDIFDVCNNMDCKKKLSALSGAELCDCAERDVSEECCSDYQFIVAISNVAMFQLQLMELFGKSAIGKTMQDSTDLLNAHAQV